LQTFRSAGAGLRFSESLLFQTHHGSGIGQVPTIGVAMRRSWYERTIVAFGICVYT